MAKATPNEGNPGGPAESGDAIDPWSQTVPPATLPDMGPAKREKHSPAKAEGTAKKYRTRLFQFHALALERPFTNTEMNFVLAHHRLNNTNQIKHDYYRVTKEDRFMAVRRVVTEMGGIVNNPRAHQKLSEALIAIGFEKPIPSEGDRRDKTRPRSPSHSDSDFSTDSHSSDDTSYSSDDEPRRSRRKRKRKHRHGRRNHKHKRHRRHRNRRKRHRRSTSKGRERGPKRNRCRSASTTSRITESSTSGTGYNNRNANRASWGNPRNQRRSPAYGRGNYGGRRGRGHSFGRGQGHGHQYPNYGYVNPNYLPLGKTREQAGKPKPPTPPPSPSADPHAAPTPPPSPSTVENTTEDSKEIPLPAPGLVATKITVMTGAGDPPGSPTGVSNTKTVSGYRDLLEHEAELTPDSELSEYSRILRNTYSEDETPCPTSSGLPVSHANLHSNTTCIQTPPCTCAPHAIASGASRTGRTKSQKKAKKSRQTQSQRCQGEGEVEKFRGEPKPSEAEKLREWQRSC